MVWRGNLTAIDRFWGGLVYLLPMTQVVVFGVFLFARLPFLRYIFLPILQLAQLLSFPLIEGFIDLYFVLFVCLYALVVRDWRIKHFIRFSTMQSLLLSIGLYLILLVVRLIGATNLFELVPNSLLFYLAELFASTLFIGMNGVCLYAIVQAVRGRYAEMPIISSAAYYQVG
jgi:hypothetical protein